MPLDIGFVLGAFGQNAEEDFKTQKSITKAMIDKFKISPSDTRAGFILFGQDARLVARLNLYKNERSLKALVDSLQNPGDGSRLDKALDMARSEVLFSPFGARNGVPKSLVVFVSHKSNVNPLIAAQKLKDLGVKIITVGVGQEADVDYLESISGRKEDMVLAREADNAEKAASNAADASFPGTV